MGNSYKFSGYFSLNWSNLVEYLNLGSVMSNQTTKDK